MSAEEHVDATTVAEPLLVEWVVDDRSAVDSKAAIVSTALGVHYFLKDCVDELSSSVEQSVRCGDRVGRGVGFVARHLPAALDSFEDLCDLIAESFDVEILKELPPYEQWTEKDLRAECLSRGLSTSGTKAELAERLTTRDAA
jgi:hypothetical protein